MQVGVFIPARLASTRLKNKLLLDDTGKPLIAYAIQRVREAIAARPELIKRVVCAADHPDLIAAAQAAGAQGVMTRADHTSGSSRIAQAAALPEYADLDVIVNVQGDEPEMDPGAIIQVAELLRQTADDVPMATLVTPIDDETDARLTDPNTVKCVMDSNRNALYFSRAPIPFLRAGARKPSPRAYHHLGIYAYRRDFLLNFATLPESTLESTEKLEQLRVLDAGYRIRVGIVDRAPPGIDTPADYALFVQRAIGDRI